MSAVPTAHPQSNGPRPTFHSEGRLVRAVRLGLMVLIVAATCYAAYGFGRLWSEWRQSALPLAAQPSSPAGVGAAAVLPLAGQWSFPELDWDFRSRDVAPAEVDALLTSLANQAPSPADVPLPDLDGELLELARSLGVEPIQQGDRQIYRLDDGDAKALLVTRPAGDAIKAVALAVAFPNDGGTWRLVELTPRSSSGPSTSTGHLLPLPKGATRAAGRFADNGALLLELVTLQSDAGSLLDQWKAAGWDVRQSGLGGSMDFSYLCARGNDVIYAWSANPPDALQLLMLVRTPDSSDTTR